MPKQASSSPRHPDDIPPPMPPARTRERRIQQLVFEAERLIEERLRSGEASPTETVAVLRLGTEYEQANLARVRAQTDYLIAQRAKAEAETLHEEMFSEAMEALTRYRGEDPM